MYTPTNNKQKFPNTQKTNVQNVQKQTIVHQKTTDTYVLKQTIYKCNTATNNKQMNKNKKNECTQKNKRQIYTIKQQTNVHQQTTDKYVLQTTIYKCIH